MSAPRLSELHAWVQGLIKEHRVPGVALGLLVDGAEHTMCFGVTSVESSLPVDEHTLFQIGSTTKTITATAVMRLVEQGRADPDAPVRSYLPDLALSDLQTATQVTVRHLLNHTAGWLGDFFEHTGDGDDALGRYVAALSRLPQITPLGSVWSYNNAAFNVAGRVIEAVTGTTRPLSVSSSSTQSA